MALPIIPALASIVSAIGTTLAAESARFIALKIFLTTVFVLVLPIVLNNFLVSILTSVVNKAGSVVSTGAQSHVMQLTGLSAYFADLLNLPLCVSILLGAVSVRFTLKLIRLG